jgi:hypothetical protein
MNSLKPKLICITPIRNESKILDRFLKCASLWADTIIISDQCSEDNSKEIALSYPKVILVENFEREYNEKQVRQILINEARKIKGPKIIFAVDADEILTQEILEEAELEKFYSAAPGTVFMANFVNICPDMKHYWGGPLRLPVAFYDDGISKFEAEKIHTFRNICPENAVKVNLDNLKIMHFQFTDWNRMESKHRWYQCWEKINDPESSAIRRYRGYHHMYSIKKQDLKELPNTWLDYYCSFGVNLKEVTKEKSYYWDKTVLGYFIQYGANFFAKEAIWDVNWNEIAKNFAYRNNKNDFRDPRTLFQKMVHYWLKKTQINYTFLPVRIIDKILAEFLKF